MTETQQVYFKLSNPSPGHALEALFVTLDHRLSPTFDPSCLTAKTLKEIPKSIAKLPPQPVWPCDFIIVPAANHLWANTDPKGSDPIWYMPRSDFRLLTPQESQFFQAVFQLPAETPIAKLSALVSANAWPEYIHSLGDRILRFSAFSQELSKRTKQELRKVFHNV